MTSKIVVNNIESDTGVSTITISSPVNLSGGTTGGVTVGTGASITSPSENTLKINAGIGNSDSVTIGGGNFLYATTSSEIYDTNGGPDVGDYWSVQIGSPKRGITGSKALVGVAGTVGLVGYASTNSAGNSIVTGLLQGRLRDNTAGSEIGDFEIYTKPSTSRTVVTLKVSGEGYVTKPYQPVATARGISGGSQNTGGEGTFQKIIFGTAVTNRGSHYSTSTGYFTCPVAGVYYVNAMFLTRAPSGSTAHNVLIYKNDADTSVKGRDIIGAAGHEQCTGVTGYIDCSVDDTLSIYVSNGNNGDFYVDYCYVNFSLFA